VRNRYPGLCYRCGLRVEPGDGHFERLDGGWSTQHAECAIAYRGDRHARGPRPETIEAAKAVYTQRSSP